MQAKILTRMNKMEIRGLKERLLSMGYRVDLSKTFVLMDWKGGVWVGSAGLSEIDFSKLNPRSVGLKLAQMKDGAKMELTISGEHFLKSISAI